MLISYNLAKILKLIKRLLILVLFIAFFQTGYSQFLMDMVDTTKDMGKGMLSMYNRFNHIRIGGYLQPQFQVAGSKGAKTYEGGDFLPNAGNRFMLRRGRIRFEFIHFDDQKGPSIQVVFQFDGTERGVFIRDFWGRIFENKYKNFALTAGMFARPFGYETNLSSSDRDSPERGRMNQILMRTERDMGAMLSFDSRVKTNKLKYLKVDVGFFNGQGLTGPAEYDSHKDFIARFALKPYSINNKVTFSAAASWLNGGLLQNNKYRYKIITAGTGKSFVADSSSQNIGTILPRKYYGADAQLKIKTKAGFTEFRAEYIWGTQTASLATSETPPILLVGRDGFYIRQFKGAYFYLLHNIFNVHHQIGIKLDFYDPNSKVVGLDIGNPSNILSLTDIKYTTLGFGYINYIHENLKLVLWYAKVFNEKTNLAGFTSDVADDVFTCRMQYRF